MSTEVKSQSWPTPEIWGGIECTINRVGNVFRDQLLYAGHYSREDDIDKLASLGIKKLRYPILWEKHQPEEGKKINWKWTEQQLSRLRAANIEPIAGLLHHGSGPAFTNLLDENFPVKLAAYASKVANKFPFIKYYTPVNEPLTTARFSGLYGFWYPHLRDEKSFFQMLINQVKGIILSMKAIRKINPRAVLVQTEDLAKIHSTPVLEYQAAFENRRRWLTYDLLCGIVDRQHFFWKYLLGCGIAEKDLLFIRDNRCTPGIMGFNYYVTSERFLDDKIENYPEHMHGGNGRDVYVDTESVRAGKLEGLEALLKEAWYRYQLPIAITECHLSCSREEQLRWYRQTWEACNRLRDDGINIKAMTAWSLLGAFDWNSVLTKEALHYEPGAFDIRDNNLRATSLTKIIKSFASGDDFNHPLLNEPGWWARSINNQHLALDNNPINNDKTVMNKAQPSPLLIIGKTGTLGSAFMRACERRSIPFVALSRQDVNILDEQSVQSAVDQYKPWAIINATGYVRVDDAETNREECYAVNAIAPSILAKVCRENGIRFMTFSSDLVFDGAKKLPYYEADNVKPLNIYGQSKAEGESKVQSLFSSSLIIRTSAFFGPWDKYNFVYHVLDSVKQGRVLTVPDNIMVSPTYVPDLTDTALDLFIDEEEGIWHLSNDGMLTWADFSKAILDLSGGSSAQIISIPHTEMGWKAERPLFSVLQSEKGVRLPTLDNALVRYFEQSVV